MENTGRILRGVTAGAQEILFGHTADGAIDAELSYATQVDRAHLLTLAHSGIVDPARVRRLLNEIEKLRSSEFLPLRNLSAPRGLYLLYEDYLIQQLGPETGGILQTGRSRNDLNATVLRLRLRRPYLRLLEEGVRLQAVLIRRAQRFGQLVMPAYTHYQAAVPITYGHYLAGTAHAFSRDIAGLFQAGTDLDTCPLGAGAVGGTTLPIDTKRTAALLGFARVNTNSVDAVGSRDLILRLLAAEAIAGVTLSRLASDLLLWLTAEFGFLKLPDHLVGSSSMMPQKRNPFLLEHVQGRSTSALGAFMAAASAMHGKPFPNSIAVGTEAVSHVWNASQQIREAMKLMRLVVAGAKPDRETMLRQATDGYTTATEVANRMVLAGVSFRTAHQRVGSMIRQAIENGGERKVLLDGPNPEAIVEKADYGGGPGAAARELCLAELRADWKRKRARKLRLAENWRKANQSLSAAVREYL